MIGFSSLVVTSSTFLPSLAVASGTGFSFGNCSSSPNFVWCDSNSLRTRIASLFVVDSAAFANSPAAWACEVWAEVVSELAVAREADFACSYAWRGLVGWEDECPLVGREGGEGAELKTLHLPVLRAQAPWLERAAAPCSQPFKVSTERCGVS